MKKIVIIVVVIIVLINLPPIKWITGPDDILYSNGRGTFTFGESNASGRNYQLCKDNFQAFKSINKSDTILFRLNKINLLKIYRWGDYLTEEKYKLPFKSWNVIEELRGPIENKTNWQDF